jgi:hypothetical protein
MKNVYPFLYSWKKCGVENFPTIPFNEIINGYKEKFWHHIKNSDEIPVAGIFLNDDPNILENFEDALNLRFAAKMNLAIEQNEQNNRSAIKNIDLDKELDRLLKEWILDDTRRLIKAQWLKWGQLVHEARQKILCGEGRKGVLRELGDKIFPPTKGGPSLLTEDQKRTLKILHAELQQCIRDIRRALDIPLKKDSSYSWGTDESENIIEFFPKIEMLFEKKELPILTKEPSLAKTSLKIITKRINHSVRHVHKRIKPRTLQNMLDSVPILFSK